MGGSRNIAIGLGAAGPRSPRLLLFAASPGRRAGGRPERSGGATYVGVATCGGTTCHGRSEATARSSARTSCMLWQDPATAAGAHSRAWAVLREPRSRGDRRSGSASARRRARRCASAATPRPAGARAAPASRPPTGSAAKAATAPPSGWLSSHYAVGGTHAANVVARPGPARKSARPRRASASTAISAAPTPASSSTTGSWPPAIPRISFELDLFTTLQQHHNEDGDYAPAQGPDRRRRRCGRSARRWRSSARSTLFADPARGTRGHLPRILFLRLPQLPPPDLRRSALPSRPRSPIRAGRSRPACRPTMTRT